MAFMIQVRDKLRHDIVVQMQKVSDELSSGRVADFGEYKRLVGLIQGLKRSLDTVDAVFNRMIDDEGE